MQLNDAAFRKMFELGLDMINLINHEGRIVYASPATPTVLGYSPDELTGLGMLDFVHTEDLPRAQNLLHDILDNPRTVFRIEMKLRHKNGEWRWMEVVVFNLLDDPDVGAIVSNGRDISTQMAIKEALQKREERLKRLVDNLPGIVYSLSNKRGGIYYSPGVETILGYTPEVLLSHPMLWHDSIHPEDLPGVDRAIDDFSKNYGFKLQYRIKDASGNWHWLYDQTMGIYQTADETIVEGVAADITEQRKAEELLRNYTAELEKKVRQRTDELQRTVNLMAGRELRIAELKETVRILRTQLQQAGLVPVADDPLLNED